MESEAAQSRARVPMALVVLVIAVLLIIAAVIVLHPFVGGGTTPAQREKKAVNTSDNRLSDAMTATARIYWGAHDMHAVTADRLQNAINGVPGPNDSPGSHSRPVRVVATPDLGPDALAFNIESKSRIVFVVFETGHWMCLAYDAAATDTISIGTGPTPESIATYTKCHTAAEAQM